MKTQKKTKKGKLLRKPKGASQKKNSEKKLSQQSKKAASKSSAQKKKNYVRKGAPAGKRRFDADEKIVGRIDAGGKGYGFLLREDGGDDLFIPARDMATALGGDRVVCVRTGMSRGAGEAKVVEILERANDTVVGTYYRERSGGVVIPDNSKIGTDIFVKSGRENGANDGEKVVVRLDHYPPMRRPDGEVIEVLGERDDARVEMMSVIRAFKLYEEFPEAVAEEGDRVAALDMSGEISRRKDYRDELIITIDGDDSRDFDDAVTLTEEGGLYRLGVHIADVAQFVLQGSKLDKEAFKRGTSVYFPDLVFPMLPTVLSNGVCSLNEGEDRLTLSVVMYIDGFGNIVRHEIGEGVIRSRARMTYRSVDEILCGDEDKRKKYDFLVPMLEKMRTLADILGKKRAKRGNIEFDIPECKIKVDENGHTLDIIRAPRLISHKIIEEFMLACNETVAEKFAELKIPFVYRVHAAPPAEKVATLAAFTAALGIEFTAVDNPSSRDFAEFLSSLDGSVSGVVNRVALRSMSKATYEPYNGGHFGLAAPYYCHFTSPIRRYPDLMIHRIIKAYLRGENVKKFADTVAEASKQSSEREKLAESAERKVDDLKKADFMRDKVGEKFVGVISGVTEWGVFVELPNTVEGLIRVENLPGDGYVFNPDTFRLDSASRSFRLGDELRVEVVSVSRERVSFALCEDEK